MNRKLIILVDTCIIISMLFINSMLHELGHILPLLLTDTSINSIQIGLLSWRTHFTNSINVSNEYYAFVTLNGIIFTSIIYGIVIIFLHKRDRKILLMGFWLYLISEIQYLLFPFGDIGYFVKYVDIDLNILIFIGLIINVVIYVLYLIDLLFFMKTKKMELEENISGSNFIEKEI